MYDPLYRHRFRDGCRRRPRHDLRAGHPWYFESHKAWQTVVKLTLTLTAIVMAWFIDRYVLDFLQLNAARLFTGFTCGVEFWSFLENAAQISEGPLFRWMRRYVRRRIVGQVEK